MEIFEEKKLQELRWVPVMGTWTAEGVDTLVFKGGEYIPPVPAGQVPVHIQPVLQRI